MSKDFAGVDIDLAHGHREKIIPIGEYIDGWGKVEAVCFSGGERFYMLTRNGVVSLQPAVILEPEYFNDEQSPSISHGG